jgi:chromosome segregation ATPase
METFETWRHETATELNQAKQELTAAGENLTAAEKARDLASAERLRIRAMLGALPQPIPGLLMTRVQPVERALHTAEGALTMAKQNVANARHRVEQLQDALDSLAAVLAPADTAEVPA